MGMKTFGPIPSRRLGRSLGINNIHVKYCSFSCVYCQIGATLKMEVERQEFYKPEELVQEVKEKVEKLKAKNDQIDYLTFVADGEPTLDVNLGKELELMKPLGIKTAVITNSTLLTREDVREELCKADWVSVKVDSVLEDVWRKVDVPHPKLNLGEILQGIKKFSEMYQGTLVTETMLVDGVNDNPESLTATAEFLKGLKGVKYHYISVPTRPPARSWVNIPKEEAINRAYQIFSEKLSNVEYLIGYEGNVFSDTGNVEEDILSITAVHPMRQDAVQAFLDKTGGEWQIIEKLVQENKLKEVIYKDQKFYMRQFKVKKEN